jgi:hypothetical protein
MDDRGDELISDSETLYGTVLTVAVTFTVSETIEDLRIESVTATLHRDGYDTGAEALNELVRITEEVPGLRELSAYPEVVRVTRSVFAGAGAC